MRKQARKYLHGGQRLSCHYSELPNIGRRVTLRKLFNEFRLADDVRYDYASGYKELFDRIDALR